MQAVARFLLIIIVYLPIITV